jgi:uncharacterized membrane protein
MASRYLIEILRARSGGRQLSPERTGAQVAAARRDRWDPVFNLYFLTALLSTSGIDTLMLLTGALLVWALASEFWNEVVSAAAFLRGSLQEQADSA